MLTAGGPSHRLPPRGGWGWLSAALAGSAALHAAALAAMLLAARADPPDPAESEGVALIFAETADLAGGAAEAPPVPPPEPPSPEAAPEPPPMPADPPPPPPPVAMNEQPPPSVPAPAAPDVADIPPPPPVPQPPAAQQNEAALPPPPDPMPQPPDTPMRDAPPPRRVERDGPPPAPRAAPAQVRLDAGAGALRDPSLGARALGAVVPPAADAAARNAPPAYPAESRRRGEEGVVRLALLVTPDGWVDSAEVSESSGYPDLDQAALEAVRRWRFRPATQAGLPVAAMMRTAVHFRLTDR